SELDELLVLVDLYDGGHVTFGASRDGLLVEKPDGTPMQLPVDVRATRAWLADQEAAAAEGADGRYRPPMASTAPPGLISTPGVLGGAVRIGGTRIDTRTVAERFRGGESVAEIAEDYD